MLSHQEVKELILEELKDLQPYVYHSAMSSNSIYIKFKDARLGSLRISDHCGIKKYKYKWNLRSDQIEDFLLDTDEGRRRFYYSFNALTQFYSRIRQYNSTIQSST